MSTRKIDAGARPVRALHSWSVDSSHTPKTAHELDIRTFRAGNGLWRKLRAAFLLSIIAPLARVFGSMATQAPGAGTDGTTGFPPVLPMVWLASTRWYACRTK